MRIQAYDNRFLHLKSDIPNTGGIRQEAIEVFKAVRAPLIRWPGGYFADCYDWRTSYAALRRKNGRDIPWKVTFWGIGNESYWLHHPQDDWLQRVIEGIRENMELASLHLYSASGKGDAFTEAGYWDALVQIDQRNRLRIESFLGAIDSVVGDQRVKLALDEWGLWHPGATMGNGCEQPCPHRDALFAARYFHLLQRYPTRVGLATIAQSVNVLHALLRTDGPRSYRTTTFHVFQMFQGHQGGTALELLHSSPRFQIQGKEPFRCEEKAVDVVTASASLDADGKGLLLTLTNADLRKSHGYDVELIGGFTAGNMDITGNRFRIELPPCSVVAVSLSR